VAPLPFHKALGGSAVLLSATLPLEVQQGLVNAFRDGLGAAVQELTMNGYPLVTLAAAGGIAETQCEVRPGLARSVTVTRLADTDVAVERIVVAASTGAAVAWVRNTVDDAIVAMEALRARGLAPLLFHARFAMVDRLAIEAEVLRRFGRDSTGEARRCVLVATQVIEQSLDIDFDLLCTDLAPADLLISAPVDCGVTGAALGLCRGQKCWWFHRRRCLIPTQRLESISSPSMKDSAAYIGSDGCLCYLHSNDTNLAGNVALHRQSG
jgi:CRISPR-associated endonuclease/helicase Cas3